MIDVPMLALGLSAVALAIRSIEKDSWRLTLLAGVTAGLGVQTKYNGSVACAAVLAWYVFHRRPMRGVVALAIAVAIVVGWEYYIAQTQGESHFLIGLTQRQGKSVRRMLHLVLPLFTQMAGLATATALLGLTAFGWRKRAVAVAVAGFAVLGIVALASLPSQTAWVARDNGKPILTLSNLYYGLIALPILGCLIRLGASLVRQGWSAVGVERLYDWFLPLLFGDNYSSS